MAIDYTKLTVNQIKDMLVTEGHCNKEELKDLEIKGKKEWVAFHQNCNSSEKEEKYEWEGYDPAIDNLVDDVDEMHTVTIEDPRPESNTPRYDSPEWNDYVMSQFVPEELIDEKYPNVNALRRVTELLLGEIIYSGPIKVDQTMDPTNSGKAVVVYQITISWKLDQYYATADLNINTDFPEKTFVSVASSWINNTDDIYAGFPEAIAETRAEGRALRKALRLNTICADERTQKDTAAIIHEQQFNVDTTTGEWEAGAMITDHQITTITIMCERLGIDLTKFINSGSKTYDDIHEITRATAANMLRQLNRYQSVGDESVAIPKDLLIGDENES